VSYTQKGTPPRSGGIGILAAVHPSYIPRQKPKTAANRQRKLLLELCRGLLSVQPVMSFAETGIRTGVESPLCPVCRTGHLHIAERMPSRLNRFFGLDSS
jgi:hypothetical protein